MVNQLPIPKTLSMSQDSASLDNTLTRLGAIHPIQSDYKHLRLGGRKPENPERIHEDTERNSTDRVTLDHY